MGRKPILNAAIRRGGAVRQTVASFDQQLAPVVVPVLVPLHSYGLLPEGCTVPEQFHDLVHFVGETTQLLMILGGILLVAGYAFCGLYWIVAGPDGKTRAVERVKHVTLGGLILVLSKPVASYILSSFTVFCASGGGG